MLGFFAVLLQDLRWIPASAAELNSPGGSATGLLFQHAPFAGFALDLDSRCFHHQRSPSIRNGTASLGAGSCLLQEGCVCLPWCTSVPITAQRLPEPPTKFLLQTSQLAFQEIQVACSSGALLRAIAAALDLLKDYDKSPADKWDPTSFF